MSTTPPSFSFEDEHTTETESQESPSTSLSSEQEQAEQQPIIYYPASTFPQEAQGEAHGGPLGCCLGTVVGIFFTMTIMVGIAVLLANGRFLGGATVPIDLLGGVVGGYLGWRIGKRVYREYQAPIVIDKRRSKARG